MLPLVSRAMPRLTGTRSLSNCDTGCGLPSSRTTKSSRRRFGTNRPPASVTVTAYCLWAFDRTGLASQTSHHPLWTQLTVVPFAISVLHVLRVLDSGGGAAPEELALRDRWLHVFGAVWLLFFLIGIYA